MEAVETRWKHDIRSNHAEPAKSHRCDYRTVRQHCEKDGQASIDRCNAVEIGWTSGNDQSEGGDRMHARGDAPIPSRAGKYSALKK